MAGEPVFDIERIVEIGGEVRVSRPYSVKEPLRWLEREMVLPGRVPGHQRSFADPGIGMNGEVVAERDIGAREQALAFGLFPLPVDGGVGESAALARASIRLGERAGVAPAGVAVAQVPGPGGLPDRVEERVAGHRDPFGFGERAAGGRPARAAVSPVRIANLLAPEQVDAGGQAAVSHAAAPRHACMLGVAAWSRRTACMELHLGTLEIAPRDDIDGAGQGVSAVDAGGAGTENLDALDGRDREEVGIVTTQHRSGEAPSVDEDHVRTASQE